MCHLSSAMGASTGNTGIYVDDTSMTHPSPTLQDYEQRDAAQLIELLVHRHTLNTIRDRVLPGRSVRAARREAIRMAQRDSFGAALEERMHPSIRPAAHDLWTAWRDQDARIARRERFRLLRRIVVDLDNLAATARIVQSSQPAPRQADQREELAWS